jgi:hypothetical protein
MSLEEVGFRPKHMHKLFGAMDHQDRTEIRTAALRNRANSFDLPELHRSQI